MKKKSPKSLYMCEGDLSIDLYTTLYDRALQIDTETDGLDFRRHKIEVVTLANIYNDVVIVRNPKWRAEYLTRLLESQGTTKYFHHAAFDLQFIKAWTGIEVYGCIECTKTLMKIVHPELESSGLGSSLRNILGVKIDKQIDHKKWKNEKYTARQKEYMVGDVLYLASLYKKLETELATRDITAVLKYVDTMNAIRTKAFDEVEGLVSLYEYRQPTPKESLGARLWWQEQQERMKC